MRMALDALDLSPNKLTFIVTINFLQTVDCIANGSDPVQVSVMTA